ncbi:hypothetical protein [Salmonella enterica]|uniref:hypothetical protein n=1 Tax=Salmonella enterica TaxID=28901 RepID=UPI0021B18542|nr:hypothetical protein [Salmonella enterica]MCT7047391.1 hypothetical protein [Salmonella enterica subsp. enterica serovar Give]MCT7249475.1 hypothetical protein [Salmonella enterica subsp. enterica serovar Give]
MGSNIIELAKLGHERAAELKASCGAVDVRSLAQLISDLATQLEVQLVRANALAAENAGLKAAFDKPQAYLSWHAIPPTWEDPLPCSEYLDAHDDAGHKNSDGTDCWPVYSKPEIETPATDAFLAEVRAQGVEMFADKYRAQLTALPTTPENIFDAAHVRLRYQIFDADEFAAQLRKGVAQ